jgi:hypothetical protein
MERDPNRQAIEDARSMTRSAREAITEAVGQRRRLDEMRVRNEAMRERLLRVVRPVPPDSGP